MTNDNDRPKLIGKLLVGGLVGWVVWRSLGPDEKKEVLKFLTSRSERMPIDDGRRSHSAIKPTTPSAAASSDITWPPFDFEFKLPKFVFSPTDREFKNNILPVLVSEPDAKWRDVISPPALVLILGKRGSGKSALAYRLLELFRYRLTPYVVGVTSQARRLLPDWIGIVPDLESLPSDSIALVDEAYLPYHARRSMAEASTSMSQILNLSRQRNQTLIFVTQEARQIDRNIASSATVIAFKEIGMFQPEFDRPELRKMVAQASQAISSVTSNKRKWSYVYSPDGDHLGLLENELASFWKNGLSKLFANAGNPATRRVAKSLTLDEKIEKAKELRSEGLSYSRIANALGVSKSTAVNYIRDYPYR